MVAITGKTRRELLKFKRGFWHNDFRDVNLDVWNIVNQLKKTKPSIWSTTHKEVNYKTSALSITFPTAMLTEEGNSERIQKAIGLVKVK